MTCMSSSVRSVYRLYRYHRVRYDDGYFRYAEPVINKFFKEKFPILILEKWGVWVVDAVNTGKVKINTTHTIIKVY